MMSSNHILHGRQKRLRIKKESTERAAKRNGSAPIHEGRISASKAIRLGARLYEEGLLAKQKREQMRITIFEQREAEQAAEAFAKQISKQISKQRRLRARRNRPNVFGFNDQ